MELGEGSGVGVDSLRALQGEGRSVYLRGASQRRGRGEKSKGKNESLLPETSMVKVSHGLGKIVAICTAALDLGKGPGNGGMVGRRSRGIRFAKM